MKKIILSLVVASLTAFSLGAYATVPTTAAPFQVVVPNLNSGIEVTLEGMYLQPSNDNLQYSIQSSFLDDVVSTNISYVKPKYDFGFRTSLGYIFPNSGNDIQIAWTHFAHNTTDSMAYFVNPRFYPGIIKADFANVSFQYDAVDLDIGQHVSLGTRLQTRFLIGVRGAQLKNNIANTYLNTVTPNAVNPVHLNSTFVGIGPRVGVDASYHLGHYFNMVGHFAAALLVGNIDANGTDITIDSGKIFSATSVTADTQRRVVPAFDAKLGVDYTIPFKNTANGSSLSIEAGYQVTQYVNAIDRFQADNVDTLRSLVVTSSVGFNGPYLSINLKL